MLAHKQLRMIWEDQVFSSEVARTQFLKIPFYSNKAYYEYCIFFYIADQTVFLQTLKFHRVKKNMLDAVNFPEHLSHNRAKTSLLDE